MLDEMLTLAFLVSLLSGMVRVATPLLLAALGELVTERSGVLNLGIEGTMVMGAFAGFLSTHWTGNPWMGVLAALVTGGLVGLLMAVLCASLKIDQIVAGLAINIFAAGLAFYGYRVAFSDPTKNVPSIDTFAVVEVPLLHRIPVVGEVFFSQYPLTYIALLMVPALLFFLYRTKYGLILRCVGENPRAVDMKGVSVPLTQYLSLLFGGMMAGAGGAFLTVASAGIFVPDISAGRGWIAIAIVIFGDWKPVRILFASFFFGFLESLQQLIQGLGIQFPYQILLALPYLCTVIALVLGRTRSGAPLSLGINYSREAS